MAGLPGIPQNLIVQTGNQVNLVSWDLSAGATTYQIQRSLDNVTYTNLVTISGSPLATSYVDSAVVLGTQYWYQVAASSDGVNFSPYTLPQSVIPAPSGEMSLGAIRLAAQQRADRVNSNFVTTQEWNSYINTSMYELYDLLITLYEDYFIATPISFPADGTTYLYALPNGSNSFTNNLTGLSFTPPALYKLMGVDLALQNATNAFVTINKFNFIDRNRFVFPNTASTIYGVFNLQYRLMGNNIEFIPTPSAGQHIRLWYIPRLTNLLQDTDTTVTGISGWIEYVVTKAAYYALTKEESDTSALVMQLQSLNDRIISSASNRDAGQPDTISDTRRNSGGWGSNGNGTGFNGGIGGFALGFIPLLSSNDQANHTLTNSIHFSNNGLTYAAVGIGLTYFFNLYCSKLSSRITFASISNFIAKCSTTFISHIFKIVGLSSKEQMIRVNAARIITNMTNIKSDVKRTFKQFISYARSLIPATLNREHRISIPVMLAVPEPTATLPLGVNQFIGKPDECFISVQNYAHLQRISGNVRKVK